MRSSSFAGCSAEASPPARPVSRRSTLRWAQYVHGDETTGDDEAILLLDFRGGAIGLAEESWNKPGGMDDRAEVFGSDGQGYADVLYGNSFRTFSRAGYGYAVEKAGSTAGWSFPIYQEIWNYGFPQEMEHFVSCVRTGQTPRENGHDGRAVVEAVFASTSQQHAEAASSWHSPSEASAPIDLWRKTPARLQLRKTHQSSRSPSPPLQTRSRGTAIACAKRSFVFLVQLAGLEWHAAAAFGDLVAHAQQLMVDSHSLGPAARASTPLELPPRGIDPGLARAPRLFESLPFREMIALWIAGLR